MTVAKSVSNDRYVQAARLAAQFSQELGIPHGTLWESQIAQSIAYELQNVSFQVVEFAWRVRFGLRRENPPL
jgi:hypothetical protein